MIVVAVMNVPYFIAQRPGIYTAITRSRPHTCGTCAALYLLLMQFCAAVWSPTSKAWTHLAAYSVDMAIGNGRELGTYVCRLSVANMCHNWSEVHVILKNMWKEKKTIIKFSRATSRVRWLKGKKTNVSRTISVLVLGVLMWLSSNPCHIRGWVKWKP
jgi:hypothetical protein